MQLLSRSDAKASGQIHYYTGIACPKGHDTFRYTSTSNCVECQRLASKVRQSKPETREQQRAARQRKSAAMPPKPPKPLSARQAALAAGSLTYVGEDCGRGHGGLRYTRSTQCVACSTEKQKSAEIREYKRRYGQENKERLAATRAENYCGAKRDAAIRRARAWAEANPDKRRAIAATHKVKRKTAERAGDSAREVAAWLEIAPKVCYWCGRKCPSNYHIDHYVPLSKGGQHVISNLVIACPSCNLAKNAKDPYKFAASVGRLF